MLHGGDSASFARSLEIPEKVVLDFSVNLNPLGPPEVLCKLWNGMMKDLIPYPPIHGEGVKEYYNKRFGVRKSMITPGNGSTELLYLVPRILRPASILIFEPSYSDYKRASMLAGIKVRTHTLEEHTGFSYPPLSMIERLLRDVDSVWIGRPNNPTGSMLSRPEIQYLAKKYPQKLFLLDESFMLFEENLGNETLIIEKLPQNIIVMSSLTKFYSLAGLRIGASISHPFIAESLNNYKEPWTVNGIANRVAPILANQTEYEDKTRRYVRDEIERIIGMLSADIKWKICGKGPNFLLLRWMGSLPLNFVLKQLYLKGVFVRDARNFAGLEGDYIRIGIRKTEENDLLLKCLMNISMEEDGLERSDITYQLSN